MSRSSLCVALVVLTGLVTLGCGGAEPMPELGKVKGKVTVDGQPGADLDVAFEPQAKGSGKKDVKVGNGSTGRTAADGSYELTYQGGGGGAKGAVVGKHTVRVTSAAGGGPAGGAAGATAIALPASVNTESNIVKDVAKGDNTIDIVITTK